MSVDEDDVAPAHRWEPDWGLGKEMLELSRLLTPASTGRCLPYVICPDGTIVVCGNALEPRPLRAELMRDYATSSWYVRTLWFEPVPLAERMVIEVYDTMLPALQAAERRARLSRDRHIRETRWSGDLYNLLLLGPSLWRGLEWGASPRTLWLMTKLLEFYQDRRCAICGATGGLVLDHDHDPESWLVRGLLCRVCNSFEGHRDKQEDARFVAYRASPPAKDFGWVYPVRRRPDRGDNRPSPIR